MSWQKVLEPPEACSGTAPLQLRYSSHTLSFISSGNINIAQDMDGEKSLEAYMGQLEAFRKSDADRDALVSAILKNYVELKQKYEDTVDDLSNEKDSRRRWQNLAGERERDLQQHKQASDSNNFVMVVIDGDGALFQDSLYAMGKDGGSEAAFKLHSEIKKHLMTTYPKANVSDWNVVVQVFLNLQGLAKNLQSCGIINNVNDLSAFGRSFGLSQPLFNFIDVGSGKERADHKIREALRLYVPIAQCRHIFFAPCHDNGYIPVLQAYKHDPAMASRITLIETRPAEPGFKELGLELIGMAPIFRADNLPTNRVTPPNTLNPAVNPFNRAPPAMQTIDFPILSSPSPAPPADTPSSLNKSTSWATVGKKPAANKTIDIAPKQTTERPHVFVNVHDDRVDKELPRPDASAEYRFFERMQRDGKYCNSYHILGECPQGEYCEYAHGERLSPGGILVLKNKARNIRCATAGACRDPKCTFGHVCKFGKNCNYDICYFPETHHMDLEPAKRAFEDGTTEWIPAYLAKHRN